jgi:hypothetical protein
MKTREATIKQALEVALGIWRTVSKRLKVLLSSDYDVLCSLIEDRELAKAQ